MAGVWSDENKLACWLQVELAALDAWADLGVVPAEAAKAIRATARAPSPERVAELEATLQHDTAAFVDAVAAELGPEGRWFHYGLTSSDVVDTALALQIRDAGALVLDGVDRALAAGVGGARGGRAARRGAPAHDLHRPLARHPRGADDVRLEARRLGLRAGPRPRPAAARAPRLPRRPVLRHGRHLRCDRPGGRANRVREARPRARAGV